MNDLLKCLLDLDNWVKLSTVGQFVLVLISIIIVLRQLQQTVALRRAANSQALSEQAGSFNSLLIQDPDIARIWHSHGKDLDRPEFEGLAAPERYEELLVQWLILHENIHHQHSKHLLDKDLYTAWDLDLRRTVRKHNLDVFSVEVTELFAGKFGEYLADLHAEKLELAAAKVSSVESRNTDGVVTE